MTDPVAALKAHEPRHDFLIAIDSDGCAFDTMELKHKECFIPNIIRYWDLQPVSKFARKAAEFVNLYSVHRGVNRFPALEETIKLLERWPEVQARKCPMPHMPNLLRWMKEETKLGTPALEAYCAEHPGLEDMQRALEWNRAVNETVDQIVGDGLPPFPYVRECLEKAGALADMMVCSQTPTAALEREWKHQGLAEHVFSINGQECGKKSEHIHFAAEGRYPKEKVLMIGDAPGDYKAARDNGALFFPVNPGDEDASWKRLYEEGLDRFFNGDYAGAYEQSLIETFRKLLPETPEWEKASP